MTKKNHRNNGGRTIMMTTCDQLTCVVDSSRCPFFQACTQQNNHAQANCTHRDDKRLLGCVHQAKRHTGKDSPTAFRDLKQR